MFRAALLSLLVAATAFAEDAELAAQRAAVGTGRGALAELAQQEAVLGKALANLGARIEALKAQETGSLTPSAELTQALQSSQTLSDKLAQVSRQRAQAERDLSQQERALHQGLSVELERAGKGLESARTPEEQRAAIEALRLLRRERDAVRGPAQGEVKAPGVVEGDDPARLQAQADALRDAEDKLLRQARALESRIVEVKDERDLDRRLGELFEDEALFDDQDRRLRVRRESPTTLASDAPAPAQTQAERGNAPSAASSGAPGGGSAGAQEFGDSSGGGASNAPPFSPRVDRAQDARPAVGAVPGARTVTDGLDDLDALQAELARIKARAQALGERAKQVEAKAKGLLKPSP